MHTLSRVNIGISRQLPVLGGPAALLILWVRKSNLSEVYSHGRFQSCGMEDVGPSWGLHMELRGLAVRSVWSPSSHYLFSECGSPSSHYLFIFWVCAVYVHCMCSDFYVGSCNLKFKFLTWWDCVGTKYLKLVLQVFVNSKHFVKGRKYAFVLFPSINYLLCQYDNCCCC